MCVCVYIYIYIYIYMCVCVYIYIYMMMEFLKKIINSLYTKPLFPVYLVYGHTMLKTPVLV